MTIVVEYRTRRDRHFVAGLDALTVAKRLAKGAGVRRITITPSAPAPWTWIK